MAWVTEALPRSLLELRPGGLSPFAQTVPRLFLSHGSGSHRDQRREGGFCTHSGTLGYCWVNSQGGREGPTYLPLRLCPAPLARRSSRVVVTLTPGPPLLNAPTALAAPWCCKL